jgi:hypothetical protein
MAALAQEPDEIAKAAAEIQDGGGRVVDEAQELSVSEFVRLRPIPRAVGPCSASREL